MNQQQYQKMLMDKHKIWPRQRSSLCIEHGLNYCIVYTTNMIDLSKFIPALVQSATKVHLLYAMSVLSVSKESINRLPFGEWQRTVWENNTDQVWGWRQFRCQQTGRQSSNSSMWWVFVLNLWGTLLQIQYVMMCFLSGRKKLTNWSLNASFQQFPPVLWCLVIWCNLLQTEDMNLSEWFQHTHPSSTLLDTSSVCPHSSVVWSVVRWDCRLECFPWCDLWGVIINYDTTASHLSLYFVSNPIWQIRSLFLSVLFLFKTVPTLLTTDDECYFPVMMFVSRILHVLHIMHIFHVLP